MTLELPARARYEGTSRYTPDVSRPPAPAPRAQRYAPTSAAPAEIARVVDTVIAAAVLLPVLLWPQLRGVGGVGELLRLPLTVRSGLLVGGSLLLWQTAFSGMGVYARARADAPAEQVVRLVNAAAVASVLTLAGAWLAGAPVGPAAIGVLWLAAVAGMLTWRIVARTLRGATPRPARTVLIVGSGPRALRVYDQLRAEPSVDYALLGFVDSHPSLDSAAVRHRYLGAVDDLERLLMRTAVDEVLIALPVKSCYDQIQRALHTCEQIGVEARYLADIFQTSLARQVFHDASFPAVALKVAHDDVRVVVKRLIDIVGSCAGIGLTAPLMLAAAAAVKATSPGPALFAQQRYGYRRRLFRMYKLRTMVADAEARQGQLEAANEARGPVFKIRDDPRTTRVGRFLRRTSIDELPQLFNVLRGDMSLVGPRPLPVRDVHRFEEASLMRRFSVLPGMTGLWQISGRSALGFDDWIALDLKYIDEWSLGLDLAILARTLPAVVRGSGAV